MAANGRSYFSLPVFFTLKRSASVQERVRKMEELVNNGAGLVLIMHPHFEMPELEGPLNHSAGRPQEAF